MAIFPHSLLYQHGFSIRSQWWNHSVAIWIYLNILPGKQGRELPLSWSRISTNILPTEFEGVFYISLIVPSFCDFPSRAFPDRFLQYSYSQEELTCFKITRVWKKVIWIFSSVSFSGQSTDFLQLELWKADTHCITVTEVIYLSHTVLCNSISHLAWAEGDTQKSIPIAARPKCTSKSRALQFNLNGLHQSQSWDKSILNWPKSQLSFRGHCVVYTWWLSAPDSAKWIWLNDITLEHITATDASGPSLHFFRESFTPQVCSLRVSREKCSQQEVKSIHVSWDLITLISIRSHIILVMCECLSIVTLTKTKLF